MRSNLLMIVRDVHFWMVPTTIHAGISSVGSYKTIGSAGIPLCIFQVEEGISLWLHELLEDLQTVEVISRTS